MRLYYGKSLHELDHFLTPTKTVPISTNNESERGNRPNRAPFSFFEMVPFIQAPLLFFAAPQSK